MMTTACGELFRRVTSAQISYTCREDDDDGKGDVKYKYRAESEYGDRTQQGIF